MSGSVLACGSAFALALILVRAGWRKLRHRAHFAARIADYALMPRALARRMPLPVACVEGGIALLLLPPRTRAPAALAAAALLGLYALAMLFNLVRGRGGMDCGCGPLALRQPLGAGQVLRNAVMIVLALWVATRGSAVPDTAGAWLLAVLLTMLLLALDRLCDLLLSRDALLADD